MSQVIMECLLITADRMGLGSSTGSRERKGTWLGKQQREASGRAWGLGLPGPAPWPPVSLFPQLWVILKIN